MQRAILLLLVVPSLDVFILHKGAAALNMHEDIPFPPGGYSLISTFRYPQRALYMSWFFRFLTTFSLYFLAAWGFIGGGFFRGIALSRGVTAFILIVLLSTEFVRGLIQRIISRSIRYEISFYTLFFWLLLASSAIAPGQFQSRRDALLIAIAPLSLFAFLLISCLFEPLGINTALLEFVLIVNLSGTIWDIYFIVWLLRIPKGTVLYVEGIWNFLVLKPTF